MDPYAIAYSVVTRAELFAGRDAHDVLRSLLRLGTELPLDRDVAERAGAIRREHRLALPDALIAATALQHGLALLTRNVRHYEPVAGLALAAR